MSSIESVTSAEAEAGAAAIRCAAGEVAAGYVSDGDALTAALQGNWTRGILLGKDIKAKHFEHYLQLSKQVKEPIFSKHLA